MLLEQVVVPVTESEDAGYKKHNKTMKINVHDINEQAMTRITTLGNDTILMHLYSATSLKKHQRQFLNPLKCKKQK
jgi:hypothetical protein